MRALAWEIWFRSEDLEVPSVLLGRYEQKPLADKIALMIQTCATEGVVLVMRNDKTPEPS